VLNIRFIGRFNLVDCLHDFASSVTIHGDEVLAHANWEIGETWLRRYGFVDSSSLFVSCYVDLITHRPSQFDLLYRFLVDPNTLSISNKWRRDRGLPELRIADIAPEQQASASA
jgi:hypothetical protein